MSKQKINLFWFRRDLRLEDNKGLTAAMNEPLPVLLLFIFDKAILTQLPDNDSRVAFIHEKVSEMDAELKKHGSGVYCLHNSPLESFELLHEQYEISSIFTNRDYEPYALKRDKEIEEWANENEIAFKTFKDQVIFEKDEILKDDKTPYTVFTPFKKRWLRQFTSDSIQLEKPLQFDNFVAFEGNLPSLNKIGFSSPQHVVHPFHLDNLDKYKEERDYPFLPSTSLLSPHLRFGTVSIRKIVGKMLNNETFISELIWREFFMQILYHFPRVIDCNFKSKYDRIEWRNNEAEFEKWCKGETGYPMVDAGMRELNQTGYMHNRVRMVVASFLCKHLLIDWKWGEAYFAEKLLDYDLSANNGNWQWAAGTGCDAAPYFRVFNPITQLQKFDSNHHYIKKWITDLNEFTYPLPMVDHKMARERALRTYKTGLESE